ncbi:DUF1217 domain-containing protein [Pelagovum sp. HNIBRBA483]|uniref:DUF1217 domain-containing protein n=1 Tax=Pelagovum sp. HNIBRBA483 TaxID=3233341 RepID=UPI0034A22FD2
MSFQPILPFGGYSGWRFLKRTLDMQQNTFARSAATPRLLAHFKEKIGTTNSVEALIDDRRLLQVALGAFGLDADLNNRAFIRKILEDGTQDPEALANRLADKRYRRFAAAFARPEGGLVTARGAAFTDRIITKFQAGAFQEAVGAVDETMRLALNLQGALGDLFSETTTNDARWYGIMGQPPLRRIFETALGLPASFASADIDTQHQAFKDRARAALGTDTLDALNDPDAQEKLLRLYFAREAVSSQPSSSASIALSLLQAARAY